MQLTATLRQRDFADCAGASSRTIGQSCNTPNQVRGSTSAKIKKKPNRLATRGTNVTLEESMYQQLGVCAPPPSPLLSDSPEPGSFTMFTGHNCSDWIYIQACRAGTYTHMQPSKHDKRVSVSVWIVAFKRSFRMEAHTKKHGGFSVQRVDAPVHEQRHKRERVYPSSKIDGYQQDISKKRRT